MVKKDKCEEMRGHLTSAFNFTMEQAFTDGEPAEHGVSDYEFAHNYEYISEVIEDALDEVGRDKVSKCMGLDNARDILEGQWQRQQARGKFDTLNRAVERL